MEVRDVVSSWLARATTVPGSSPSDPSVRKSWCEDRADVWKVDGGIALAVADGVAQSLKASEAAGLAIAALRFATSTATFSNATDMGGVDVIRDMFLEAHQAFITCTQQRVDTEEWKTTLSVVIVVNAGPVLVASIGDSILLLEFEDDRGQRRMEPVLYPTRRDGTTATFDDSRELKAFAVDSRGLNGVVLSTDGLERFVQVSGVWPSTIATPDPLFANMLQIARERNFLALEKGLWNLEAGLSTSDLRRKGDDIGVALATR